MATPHPTARKKLSNEGIRAKYRNAILRFVARCEVEFFKEETSKFFYSQSNFRGFLKLGPHNREGSEIWAICAADPIIEGRTFQAQVLAREADTESSDLKITLKAGAEWSDARAEAAALLGTTPISLISDKIEEAYRWITRKEHLGRTWSERLLLEKFKIDPNSKLLSKLHLFADPRIRIQQKGYWQNEVYVSESPLPELSLWPLNPVFPTIPVEYAKADIECLRRFFEDLILDRAEVEDIFLVFRIETRREMRHCFPHTGTDSPPAKSYCAIFGRMPVIHGTRIFYSFSTEFGSWHCGLQLLDHYTWDEVKALIHKRRNEKPPTEKYGLSEEAANVLTWLLDQDYEDFERHLSPAVEGHLKLELGIDIEKVGKKNLHQLFHLICKELSEKTEFEVEVVPWAEGYRDPTLHLFFRQKWNTEEAALASVQHLLREWGTELSRARIRQTLHGLKDEALHK